MNNPRNCGCKGIRTCLICEKTCNLQAENTTEKLKKKESYVYCPMCDKAWPGWNIHVYRQHPNHEGMPIDYPGVYIQLDFLNAKEADSLVNALDEIPWESSQSGRRKQNFGPKCNFKKQRLRIGDFNGFPKSTKFVQEKLLKVPLLKDFQSIEQCTLEYNPDRGASIDPHIDDCWIWGERIVTVNARSDSVLTMIPYTPEADSKSRYNLPLVADYTSKYELNGINSHDMSLEDIVVRLPMPERSLIVLFGSARFKWEHAVLREDITSRRVCLAYREFTPPYLPGGPLQNESTEIFQKALNFW